VVTAKLELKNDRNIPSLVCIEPATIPTQGILSVHALARVGLPELDSTQLTSPLEPKKTDASANNVYVMLSNFSQVKLNLPKATFLGLAEQVSETLVDQINFGRPQDTVSY
jgi:hypothetical protein